VSLLTFLYALLIDIFIIRFIPIFFGSLIEAKNNLKNCYYLTEAHGGSADTTRDLIEDELNLVGEFYEDYDRPILNVDQTYNERTNTEYPRPETNSTPGGGPMPSEEDAILRSHRMNEEGGGTIGVSGKLLNYFNPNNFKNIRRRLPTKCSRVILLETTRIQTISLSLTLQTLAEKELLSGEEYPEINI